MLYVHSNQTLVKKYSKSVIIFFSSLKFKIGGKSMIPLTNIFFDRLEYDLSFFFKIEFRVFGSSYLDQTFLKNDSKLKAGKFQNKKHCNPAVH